MNIRIASLVSAAALSLGLLATPAAADVGVWFGPQVGIGFGHGGVGVGVGIGVGPGYYHDDWHGHCSKSEALHRAASMGVKKRWVSGVTASRITVKGVRKGHPVKVVMYRASDHCSVKSMSYL